MLGSAGERNILCVRDDIVIPVASEKALVAPKLGAQRPGRDMRLIPCRVRLKYMQEL